MKPGQKKRVMSHLEKARKHHEEAHKLMSLAEKEPKEKKKTSKKK